uniref:Uncharacterized protein n=1 Tax=Coccolithus braarudii TaxID=221442 RepID=A0A7S0PY62_9EUKA|mmetsp:Transcript_25578/g.55290  ORF Transcript_25578/g.55290 Transcript_25578/m.55290 type:complete len:195 (+) Transcript_25578:163-747(+)
MLRRWCGDRSPFPPKDQYPHPVQLDPRCAYKPAALGEMLAQQRIRVDSWASKWCTAHGEATHPDLTPKRILAAAGGHHATRSALCNCVHQRTCCTFPICKLYNELVLLAAELRKPGAIEAIFYLEAQASASDVHFAAGEEAARKAHRSVSHQRCDARGPILVSLDLARRKVPFALAIVTRQDDLQQAEGEEELY